MSIITLINLFKGGLKSVLCIGTAHTVTMGRLFDLLLLKFHMFLIFLNINSSSYSFRTIACQNSVKYSLILLLIF